MKYNLKEEMYFIQNSWEIHLFQFPVGKNKVNKNENIIELKNKIIHFLYYLDDFIYRNNMNKYNIKGLVKLGVTPLSQGGSWANFYCVKFKQEILESKLLHF